MTGLTLRQRVIRGAGAQVFNHAVRVIVQLGGVSILLPVWGLERYGEWLILAALPTYLAFSDLGFFAAASYDMIMAVAREDEDHALAVFRSVSRGVGILLLILAVVLPLVAWVTPITSVLNLHSMSESTAALAVVMLGLDTLLVSYAGLLNGGFASAGHYGDGAVALGAISLLEFAGLTAGVVLTGNVAVAAAAMLGARLAGTLAMYATMRRRAPYLSVGRRVGDPRVMTRLTGPALASAGFPTGLALNIQGMVLLIGLTAGAQSAAIFSTVRTVSRVVIQLLGSVSVIVAPEFAKAFARNDVPLMRRIHQRSCHAAVWLALPVLLILIIFGAQLIRLWTGGRVDPGSGLLYLFLAAAAIDSLWYTSLAVLFSTNRHRSISVIFILANVLSLPLAYLLLDPWGLDGAAVALLLVEVLMLVAVLRQSLPAAGDDLRSWLEAISRPPSPTALRTQIRRVRTRATPGA